MLDPELQVQAGAAAAVAVVLNLPLQLRLLVTRQAYWRQDLDFQPLFLGRPVMQVNPVPLEVFALLKIQGLVLMGLWIRGLQAACSRLPQLQALLGQTRVTLPFPPPGRMACKTPLLPSLAVLSLLPPVVSRPRQPPPGCSRARTLRPQVEQQLGSLSMSLLPSKPK